MKLHLITVGSPKLAYAKSGWTEYLQRLNHYHQVRVTHIADKHNTADYLLAAAFTGHNTYIYALTIGGPQPTSHGLAAQLDQLAQQGREVSFLIGGPDGLPIEVIQASHQQLGLSELTFPHDLAMVILAEALYRASTINAGQPYHR